MLNHEISLIIIQSFFIFWLFSNSFDWQNIEKKNQKLYYFSNLDLMIVNIIIFSNLLLLFSIFSIKPYYLFYPYLVYSIFFFIKDIKSYKKKNINITNVVLLIFVFALSINTAYGLELGWDVQWFWYLKTLNFYQEQSFLNLKTLPVSDYPHLGPYLWGFFWKFPLNNYEYLGRIFYIYLYILAIFSISECLKISKMYRIIFSLIVILVSYNSDLFDGDADVLIFIYILIASKFIYYLHQQEFKKYQKNLILIILAIANCLYWTKHEGIIFISFIIFSTIIFNRTLIKSNLLKIILTLFIIIFFKIFILQFYEMNLIDTKWYDFEKTIYFTFQEFIFKISKIFFYLNVYLIQNTIFLVSLTLLFFNFRLIKSNNLLKTISLFFILNILFIFIAYFLKSTEIELQIKHSMKDLLNCTAGFYLLIIINFINQYTKKKNIKI